jgi:hypothetical protein
MLAYKVLSDGRSRFSGWSWPLPEGEQPGEWVQSSGPLKLAGNGIHACTVAQLPQWLGAELWRIELDGEIVETEPALLAARGRLLAPVAQWDHEAHVAFATACAVRARLISAEVPDGEQAMEKIERFARLGRAAATAYWCAVLAGQRAGGRRSGPEYDDAFARERGAQAGWLRSELGLSVG